MASPASPQRPPRGFVRGVQEFVGSLAGRLLALTVAAVSLGEALVFAQALSGFHEGWLRERMNLRVEGDPRSHPMWRDALAALTCTQRLIKLARETGKRIHVLHVTSREEMEFLVAHKDVATAEATPAMWPSGSSAIALKLPNSMPLQKKATAR